MKSKKTWIEFPACLHILLTGYSPAESSLDASHFFSTAELAEAIEEHTGEIIPACTIVTEMKQMGFGYGVKGDLRLMWLLKKVE